MFAASAVPQAALDTTVTLPLAASWLILVGDSTTARRLTCRVVAFGRAPATAMLPTR